MTEKIENTYDASDIEIASLLADTSADEVPKAWRDKIKEAFKKPEFLSKLRETKILGKSVEDMLIGFGTGTATRMGVKYALHAMTGASGIALAAGAGGTVAGLKEYLKERSRDFSREEINAEILKLAEDKQVSVKDKLTRYLELVEKKSKERKGVRAELIKELNINVVRKKKVIKAALIGAGFGALGAFLVDQIGQAIGDHFKPQEIVQNTSAVSVSPAETTTYIQTCAPAICENARFAGTESFIGVVDKGEGVTHAAREALHDYLTEAHQLGDNTELSKEQLIYAEDYLQKMFGEHEPQVGERIGFRLNHILEAVEKAKGLTDDQINNLGQYVGQAKLDLDYTHVLNDANHQADAILKAATEKAQAAAAEAANSVAEAQVAVEATAEKVAEVAPVTQEIVETVGMKEKLMNLASKAAKTFVEGKYTPHALGLATLGIAWKLIRNARKEAKQKDAEKEEATTQPIPPVQPRPEVQNEPTTHSDAEITADHNITRFIESDIDKAMKKETDDEKREDLMQAFNIFALRRNVQYDKEQLKNVAPKDLHGFLKTLLEFDKDAGMENKKYNVFFKFKGEGTSDTSVSAKDGYKTIEVDFDKKGDDFKKDVIKNMVETLIPKTAKRKIQKPPKEAETPADKPVLSEKEIIALFEAVRKGSPMRKGDIKQQPHQDPADTDPDVARIIDDANHEIEESRKELPGYSAEKILIKETSPMQFSGVTDQAFEALKAKLKKEGLKIPDGNSGTIKGEKDGIAVEVSFSRKDNVLVVKVNKPIWPLKKTAEKNVRQWILGLNNEKTS